MHENEFCSHCTTVSSSNILFRSVNEQRLNLLPGTQCTCSHEILHRYPGPQRINIHVIFTSAWPLRNLIRELYSRPDKQTHHYHPDAACVNCSPRPTCPNPDSADLYQAALVNMPWGMKLANICARCVWGEAMWDVLIPHEYRCAWRIDGDQKSFIWVKAEWLTELSISVNLNVADIQMWKITITQGVNRWPHWEWKNHLLTGMMATNWLNYFVWRCKFSWN